MLISGRSHFEDPPSIAEGIGGRVTDYRVTVRSQNISTNITVHNIRWFCVLIMLNFVLILQDFGRFMEENRLAPYEIEDEESSVSPNKKGLKFLPKRRLRRKNYLQMCNFILTEY